MKRTPPGNAAFSLAEVTLALAISAFCLIAIFGLLPVGMKSNEAAIEQTAANGIISAVAADLRATPPSTAAGQAARSSQFGIDIPANPVASSGSAGTFFFSNSGACLSSPQADARYRLTIRFLPNGTASQSATFATLQVSWPPSVDPAQAAGSCHAFIALDRN